MRPATGFAVTMLAAGGWTLAWLWAFPFDGSERMWLRDGVLVAFAAMYEGLAIVAFLVSRVRPPLAGRLVYLRDVGLPGMILAVPLLGVAPVWVAVGCEAFTRGLRGTGAAVAVSLVGAVFGMSGRAVLSAYHEVRVGHDDGPTVTLIDGRGFPRVTTFRAADVRIEVGPRLDRLGRLRVWLVDSRGTKRLVGMPKGEAEEVRCVADLRGG